MTPREYARTIPIHEGDLFTSALGVTWRVIETKPGGKVTLFDLERCKTLNSTHSYVRASMTRVGGGR